LIPQKRIKKVTADTVTFLFYGPCAPILFEMILYYEVVVKIKPILLILGDFNANS